MKDMYQWDKKIGELRQSLESMVMETGSLTDARVLSISSLLDQAVVAHLLDQQKNDA